MSDIERLRIYDLVLRLHRLGVPAVVGHGVPPEDFMHWLPRIYALDGQTEQRIYETFVRYVIRGNPFAPPKRVEVFPNAPNTVRVVFIE